jgi:hypothetical protein
MRHKMTALTWSFLWSCHHAAHGLWNLTFIPINHQLLTSLFLGDMLVIEDEGQGLYVSDPLPVNLEWRLVADRKLVKT